MPGTASTPTVVVDLRALPDALVAAETARAFGHTIGLDRRAAAELATSTSELATNALRHGGGGRVELWSAAARVVVRTSDRGPGDATALRARLGRVRVAPIDARDEHGLATVARFMDLVGIAAREGGGIVVVAWRALARRSRW